MFFVVMCFDRPGSAQVRAENIPDHLRYLEKQGPKVHTGGSLKDLVTGAMLGSLYIIDVEAFPGVGHVGRKGTAFAWLPA